MDDIVDVPDDVQRTAANINEFAESFFDYIFEAVLLYPVFSIHRIAKLTGTAAVLRPIEASTNVESDVDIFANPRNFIKQPKTMEVYCDECNRSIAASRFAPHLEKCMGMGRNSSRIARRRLANYVSLKGSSSTGRLRDSMGRDSDLDHSDEDSRHTIADDDEDWTSSRRSKRARKTKSRAKPKSRQRQNLEKMDSEDRPVASFA